MVIFEGVAMLMFESFMAMVMVVPLAQVFPMDIGRLWTTDARPSEDQVQMISLLHYHAAYRRDRCVGLGEQFCRAELRFQRGDALPRLCRSLWHVGPARRTRLNVRIIAQASIVEQPDIGRHQRSAGHDAYHFAESFNRRESDIGSIVGVARLGLPHDHQRHHGHGPPSNRHAKTAAWRRK